VKAVVFAYHDVGCMGVRVLKRLGVDVARVYTHDDDPNENHWYGSVAKTCAEEGVTCTTANPHLPEEIARIAAIAPDAIFSLYYRDMIKDTVLSLAKRGAVNLHGSYLPRYRGRAPVNWQILHGETQGGVTLHHMVKKADAGDIVHQEAFEIGPADTGRDVYEKMLPAAERVLRATAMLVLAGTAPRTLQMESKATYYGRRRPEDGRIEWRWAAEDVRNLVRAVTHPYPGAFTFAGTAKILVWWTEHVRTRDEGDLLGLSLDARRVAPPGTVRRAAGGVFVACGDWMWLRLDRIEIDGREGDAKEFADILRDGIQLGGS
jgi:UDP-4-amino-4-deoxy-L-arabinose formyltransferase/UDP-glucuronic acid dehydrogenase (UDP-4-keto-hexauronic acid decarboxylating)